MKTRPEKTLDWINFHLARGYTVDVSNHLRTTRITPKTAAKFQAAGVDLFKIDSEGNLRMAHGRRYDIVLIESHRFTAHR